MKPFSIAAAAVLLASTVASADPREDFAFDVKEATGNYYSAWVITKLTNFKVGAKCWEKMQDGDKYDAIHLATFYVSDIAEYAKKVTGDDWASIEVQNNSDRENNKKLVEPMMDDFKKKLSFNISVDGDDCNAEQGALWLKYWGTIGTALNNYPPKAAKVTIDLQVKPKLKDIKVTVDKTGSKFTIVGPSDIEPKQWSDKIEKAFKKVAKPI